MENLIDLGHNEGLAGVASDAEVAGLNKSLTTGGPAYASTLPDAFSQGQVFQTVS